MNIWKTLRAARPGDSLPPLLFLDDADSIPAGPSAYHGTKSVREHIADCMNALAGDPLAVWMALAHDAGKLTTPRDMLPQHFGHEERGEFLVAVWAREARLPENWRRYGCMAARQHMKGGRYFELRPATRLDLLREVEPCADAFWRLVDVDSGLSIRERAFADMEKLNALPVEGVSWQRRRQMAVEILGEKDEETADGRPADGGDDDACACRP